MFGSFLKSFLEPQAEPLHDEDARLAHGWRAETAGGPITRLVSGDAALAFEGSNIVLEERSRRPVV